MGRWDTIAGVIAPTQSHDPGQLESRPGTSLELARTALVAEVGDEVVGEHLGAAEEAAGLPEDGTTATAVTPTVETHRFTCLQAGYRGWVWAVTVVTLPGERPTVDEVVMLPGDEAIVAPSWVPWRDRIRPGDLSPGDLLPTDEDDPRLVPTWLGGDRPDPWAQDVVDEVGLGRSRILSLEGRVAAAERWYAGEAGPDVPLAQSAPGRCGGCGYLVRLADPLAATFGVCANERANDDGRVVALDHGCGAHSEAQLRTKQLPPPLPDPVYDTLLDDAEIETF